MRRALAFALALAAGCGAARPGRTAPPTERPTLRVEGLEVAVLPRPTEGLVHASLWIDAGSLDGAPPAAATLAAWAAAGSAEGLRARTSPDLTTLWAEGDRSALPELVERLALALRTRELAPERHATLRARLDADRRRARALPGRRAQALAMEAAWGEGASPFAGDPGREAVEGFLADHYGPARALLVVVGDVTPEGVEARVREAFRGAPAAARDRATEPPSLEEAISIEAGTETRLSVALHAPNAGFAWAAAEALASPERPAEVFAHRWGASALLSPRDGLTETVHATALVAVREGRPPAPTSPHGIAERLAHGWRAGEGRLAEPRISAGVVCADDGGFEACRDAARRGFARALELARAEPEVTPRGPAFEALAASGARVRVEAREGDPVGFALRFEAGSAPRGELALLARLLADACAEAEVRADGEGLTLVARAEAAHWRAALDGLARCALGPVRSDERRRIQLLRERRLAPERGWIARALAPGAEARVAPEGSARQLAGLLDPVGLAGELRVGARTTLAIVGPVPAEDALQRATARLGLLPEGEEAVAPRWGEPVPLVAEEWEGEVARVVVGWRSDAGGRDARPVAEAFARGAAEALTAEGRLLWFAGDAGEWGAWAAVALEVPIERLETLPLRARDAAPARVEVAERVEAARWRTSDAGEAASRLARTGATR
ncbi:MAG TPA: hypothetical protein RMH80_10710, partial [Polyangiaceae bacterium LLY-WYZ-15_(1-7)]|nr:hypothetical protein [Polyangiaceae bacterium LLY-WYZ-15_(1-7)]